LVLGGRTPYKTFCPQTKWHILSTVNFEVENEKFTYLFATKPGQDNPSKPRVAQALKMTKMIWMTTYVASKREIEPKIKSTKHFSFKQASFLCILILCNIAILLVVKLHG
jgi:hypothetical protein